MIYFLESRRAMICWAAFGTADQEHAPKQRRSKDHAICKNQGTRIYYEVEGQGPPVVLAHGMSGDTSFWRGYGYVDKLKAKYTVILFDARGHGRSDKPHEVENYDYRLRVGDVISVMDALGLVKTHYWGYSMGAHTGLGMAKLFPERLLSLVIGAATAGAGSDDAEPGPLLKMFRRGCRRAMSELWKT